MDENEKQNQEEITSLQDLQRVVESEQGQESAPPPSETVKTYLVWSILATLCCCQPLGIIAIIFSALTSGRLKSGDMEGAQSASKMAKTICWIAFGLGLISYVLVLFLYGFAAITALIGGAAE